MYSRTKGLLFALAGSLALTGPALAQELNIAGSGGVLAEVVAEIYDKPFTQATGIKVNALATTDRSSALRAMAATGNVIWDVTELSGSDYTTGHQAGWFLPIDWHKLDPAAMIAKEHRYPDAVPYTSFSNALGYRKDKIPAGKTVNGWQDFWDVKAFPGPRGLKDSPECNLEYALIADGVPAEDVYKVLATKAGVDRAFAKLDGIKPHVRLWWTAGAQPGQALKDGEVYFTTAPNGRFAALQKAGVPVEIVWNGAANVLGYWAAVKGTKQPDAAMKYLAFTIASPERAANFARRIAYPGFTRGALELMTPDEQKQMPTYPANLAVQYKFDDGFWNANRKPLNERWREWLLK